MESKEKLFYDALKNIFVGEKIEGQGGYVNLMRIKSKYYEKLEKALKQDIEKATEKKPSFREELYDKLYTFFKRYFNPAGCILFSETPYHYSVYERIYTDDRDMILFYKTKDLYYIKTDRLYRELSIEVDGVKFKFDVSRLEYKKSNEKRKLIYEFDKIEDDTIVLKVLYSERGKETDEENIVKKIKKHGYNIKEEALEKAIRTFEKQSEVDYFLHKNPREFLKEQLKLWLHNYIYEGGKEWSIDRINQLMTIKNIAEKVIDLVAQFEEELLKVWKKPKFVRKSNYVITLDRIASKEGGIKIIEELLNHTNIEEQIKEWKELGIVDESFRSEEVLKDGSLNPKHKFLPIDTKYFKDLELDILSLFDNLDNELDGWLIKSENWQALNTILPKFKEKVQTIYIDPPFNKEQEADYFYSVKYKDSTWATMLENRLRLAKEFLKDTGSIFVRCDYNGNWIVRPLMDEIFGKENFRNEIIINRKRQPIGTPNKFEVESEFLFLFGKTSKAFKKDIYKKRSLINMKWTSFLKQEERKPAERKFFGKVLYPPPGQHFALVQEKVDKLLKEHYLRLVCKECGAIYYWDEENSLDKFIEKIFASKNSEKFKYFDITIDDKVFGITELDRCLNCNHDSWKVEYLTSEETKIGDNWKDIPSYEDTWGFRTENSEILLKRVIESTSNEGDLVMDFFLGSGTTIAVAHKLKRKWIGIEMGEHFYSVILPRMKKVLAYDKSGISKEKDVKEKYNENNAGGFFKYYELEQYEDVLSNLIYEDTEPLESESIYTQKIFLKDEKMLRAIEIDGGNVKVDFSKLYPDIDLAETLSNLKGKWIKKLNSTEVEFENGEKFDFKNMDFKLIKSLIWWI
ncbi:MAG: site-specific DNA-methyltransferase [Aquificaceae bacterium]